MNDFQAAEAIRRAARDAELLELEERTRQNEAAELAEALAKVPSWRAEYEVMKKRGAVAAGELAAIDEELPSAIEALRFAHAELLDLLQRRRQMEQGVVQVNTRLSRLAGWIGGINWLRDSIAVDPSPADWRLTAFMDIPFPE